MATLSDEAMKMDFEELFNYFEEKKIPCDHLETLEELQVLFDKTSVSMSSEDEPDSPLPHQETLNDVIEQDRKRRLELAEIYDMLISYIKNPGKGAECILPIMEKTHDNFEKTLAGRSDELLNDKCAIIVAGETSAGKSSLLNLMLGTDVLAESLLGTTSTICRLHNSKTKSIKAWLENDETKVIESNDEDFNWKTALKPYLTSRDTEGKPKVKQVDVYWPIPMLQENITIVDTPGIGENDQLTDVLLSYLPKAVAFIYVVNSANSGGIQDDNLLRILNHQQTGKTVGDQPFPVNYDTTIFVCNKWDKVLEEEDSVWNFIKNRIKYYIPRFPEDQILKMSVTEADRYKKSGLGSTPKYKKLLEAIEKLVGQSMQGKIKQHYTWIKMFALDLRSKINSRINHAKNDKYLKDRLKEDVRKRLSKLEKNAESVKYRLIEIARRECENIGEQLHKHLNRDDIQKQILTWSINDAPNIKTGDLEVTNYRAEQRIMARIRDVIKHWEDETGIVEQVSEKLKTLFVVECQLLGKECTDINLLIEGQSHEWPDSLEKSADTPINVEFTTGQKVILAVTSPLWVSFAILGTLIVVPTAFGFVVREMIDDKKRLKIILSNIPLFMRKLAQKTIDERFTEEKIYNLVFSSYFRVYENKITELCTDYIPKQIAADRRLVNDIVDDMRTSSQILGDFEPLLIDINEIIDRLRLFEINFPS